MTPQTLAIEFGPQNVTSEDISVGGGFFEKGTVLFPQSPDDRLQIHWRDENVQHTPRLIVVRAAMTRWKTPDGVTLGTSLQMLERLNRRPFRLRGFAWEGSGGVRNWSGGALDRHAEAGCEITVTLGPPQNAAGEYAVGAEKFLRQVLGERQFSSGHPAMQALKPRVTGLYARICVKSGERLIVRFYVLGSPVLGSGSWCWVLGPRRPVGSRTEREPLGAA